jgi:hypothetical protein
MAVPFCPHDEHEFRRSPKEVQMHIDQTPDPAVCRRRDLEAFRTRKPAD